MRRDHDKRNGLVIVATCRLGSAVFYPAVVDVSDRSEWLETMIAGLRQIFSFWRRRDVSVSWVQDQQRREHGQGIDQSCISWDAMRKQREPQPAGLDGEAQRRA